ncbi:MAG: hypothetical protein JSW42_05120, partial [Chloroflexota bacterium]
MTAPKIQDVLINPIIDCADDLIENLRTVVEHGLDSQFSSSVSGTAEFPGIGLRRSARLPVLAGIYEKLQIPILLLTDRTDRALTLYDELGLLSPDADRLFFPEPGPLFYENSPWGERTRRDRLLVLTKLASFHIPAAQSPTWI